MDIIMLGEIVVTIYNSIKNILLMLMILYSAQIFSETVSVDLPSQTETSKTTATNTTAPSSASNTTTPPLSASSGTTPATAPSTTPTAKTTLIGK